MGWLNVDSQQITEKGGADILSRCYGGSLLRALQTIYPSIQWITPDLSNHQLLFQYLSNRFNIQQLDDWYSIKITDLHAEGCKELVQRYYKGSLLSALKRIYPDYDWQPWKFAGREENHRAFFEELGKNKLNIKQLDDWYSVRVKDIYENGGKSILAR